MANKHTVTWGDRVRLSGTVTVRDENGNAQPSASLTGWKLWFYGKHPAGLRDADAQIRLDTDGGGVVILDAAARTVRADIKPADWAKVPADKDITLKVALKGRAVDANEVHTLWTGELEVKTPIVRTST